MEKEKLVNHLLIIMDTMCPALYQMFSMHDVIKTAQWGIGIISPIINIGKPGAEELS